MPCAVCLRLVTFPCRFDLAFATLSLHPGPYQPLGGSPVTVPLRLCVPALPSPSFPPTLGIVKFRCPCQVDFCEKAREQGAYTPWQLRALVLATPT